MKLKELERTPWAKEVKKEGNDKTYLQSLIHALDCWVYIFRQTECKEWSPWTICVAGTDFWLTTCKTKREALALCEKMGWRVKK